MKYKVHRFDLRMTADQQALEQFLNSLAGEVNTIVPLCAWCFGGFTDLSLFMTTDTI